MNEDTAPKHRRITFGKALLGLLLAFLTVEIVMLPFPWTAAKLQTKNPGFTAVMRERIR